MISWGGWELDEVRLIMPMVVEFTRTEYKFMKMMIISEGEPVSVQFLAAEFSSKDNARKVCEKVRRKIGYAAIVTQHGVSYTLIRHSKRVKHPLEELIDHLQNALAIAKGMRK